MHSIRGRTTHRFSGVILAICGIGFAAQAQHNTADGNKTGAAVNIANFEGFHFVPHADILIAQRPIEFYRRNTFRAGGSTCPTTFSTLRPPM